MPQLWLPRLTHWVQTWLQWNLPWLQWNGLTGKLFCIIMHHWEKSNRLAYSNYTKPTRIAHQADQEMFEYTNYTKPTRIGHQADQKRLGYSNYTKPTLLFVRNMPLAVAARDPSTEIPLLGARQCSCAGSFKSTLVSLDVPRPTKSSCSDLVVCKQHSTSKDDHLTVPYISYG